MVKMNINNYLSDYSLNKTNVTAYSLFIHPFADAAANFRAVSVKSFSQACGHILAALALLIPLINALAVCLFRKYATTIKSQPNASTLISKPVVQLQPNRPQPACSSQTPMPNAVSLSSKVASIPSLAVVLPPMPALAQVPPQASVSSGPVRVQEILVPCPQITLMPQTPASILAQQPLPSLVVPIQTPVAQVAAVSPIAIPNNTFDLKATLNKFVNEAHLDQGAAKPIILSCLSRCSHNCISTKTREQEVEAKILALMENVYTDQTINYVSVGSGSLLQDWLNIAKLIQKGFYKFAIHLIDESYDTSFKQSSANRAPPMAVEKLAELKEQFQKGLEALGAAELNVQTHISVAGYAQEYAEAPINILTSVDVPSGTDRRVGLLEVGRLVATEGRQDPTAFYLHMVGGSYTKNSQIFKNEDVSHDVTGYNYEGLQRLYAQINEQVASDNRGIFMRRANGTAKATDKEICQISWKAFIRTLYNLNTRVMCRGERADEIAAIKAKRPEISNDPKEDVRSLTIIRSRLIRQEYSFRSLRYM